VVEAEEDGVLALLDVFRGEPRALHGRQDQRRVILDDGPVLQRVHEHDLAIHYERVGDRHRDVAEIVRNDRSRYDNEPFLGVDDEPVPGLAGAGKAVQLDRHDGSYPDKAANDVNGFGVLLARHVQEAGAVRSQWNRRQRRGQVREVPKTSFVVSNSKPHLVGPVAVDCDDSGIQTMQIPKMLVVDDNACAICKS
jgi:hypothetical protein